jgi:hypothetical protein
VKRPSVFIGGPEHGKLHDADWVAQYIEPVPTFRERIFGAPTFDLKHERGIYRRRQYFFFGRIVTAMVDEKLEPDEDALARLLADALLNDNAKAASPEPER